MTHVYIYIYIYTDIDSRIPKMILRYISFIKGYCKVREPLHEPSDRHSTLNGLGFRVDKTERPCRNPTIPSIASMQSPNTRGMALPVWRGFRRSLTSF